MIDQSNPGVSGPTQNLCWSLVYFMLICVYSLRYVPCFIMLHVHTQFYNHHLSKGWLFFNWIIYTVLLKTIWPYIWVYLFGALSSISSGCKSVFLPATNYFDFCDPGKVEISKYEFPKFPLISQGSFAFPVLFYILYEFLNGLLFWYKIILFYNTCIDY